MKINRFSIFLAIMVCSLVSAGCRDVITYSFSPSPDGSVIASIKSVNVWIPFLGEPIDISKKEYLRIQKILPSTESSLKEMLITNERGESYFLYLGGLTRSPNGRSVAFTTGHVGIPGDRGPCRLWIVGMSAKPQKALIAENVHSFRWEDDTHLVYVTEDGEVYRATISDDGAVLELKTLFSAGNLDGAYDYAYHLSRYEFDNPLSPHADYFVHGNGRNLTIVNLSTATIERSFPLLGMPIKFWWDDAGRDCVIGVKVTHKETYHYYLYQREGGTLTNIVNPLESESNAALEWVPSGYGPVWCSDGKHFVLNSGHPYYKTWLFDTASWCAVWMEREIKRIKDGNSSQLTTTPLPLEHLEYDSSQDPLPEPLDKEYFKRTMANHASRVVIEPSPRGNLLAVRLPEDKQKDAKSTSTCYVLEIVTGPKGKMSLAVRKKIESGRKKSFLWIDFWIPESFFWTADGRGLLFVADDKFRLESIP